MNPPRPPHHAAPPTHSTRAAIHPGACATPIARRPPSQRRGARSPRPVATRGSHSPAGRRHSCASHPSPQPALRSPHAPGQRGSALASSRCTPLAVRARLAARRHNTGRATHPGSCHPQAASRPASDATNRGEDHRPASWRREQASRRRRRPRQGRVPPGEEKAESASESREGGGSESTYYVCGRRRRGPRPGGAARLLPGTIRRILCAYTARVLRALIRRAMRGARP